MFESPVSFYFPKYTWKNFIGHLRILNVYPPSLQAFVFNISDGSKNPSTQYSVITTQIKTNLTKAICDISCLVIFAQLTLFKLVIIPDHFNMDVTYS